MEQKVLHNCDEKIDFVQALIWACLLWYHLKELVFLCVMVFITTTHVPGNIQVKIRPCNTENKHKTHTKEEIVHTYTTMGVWVCVFCPAASVPSFFIQIEWNHPEIFEGPKENPSSRLHPRNEHKIEVEMASFRPQHSAGKLHFNSLFELSFGVPKLNIFKWKFTDTFFNVLGTFFILCARRNSGWKNVQKLNESQAAGLPIYGVFLETKFACHHAIPCEVWMMIFFSTRKCKSADV